MAQHGLGTNDVVEAQDPDNDGAITLNEWLRDTNPTNATPPLRLEWMSGPFLTAQDTSPARWYEVQQTTNLASGAWQVIAEPRGTGSNLVFDVTTERNQHTSAFYRLRPKVY